MMRCIAAYMRLSQDDVDIGSNSLKDESDSIHSQRLLIQQYRKEHTDLRDFPVIEFVDDGYTGTNFDRPEFQRMIEKVRSGEVVCIIVKDLSRFGRNYLEVGDYLEHIFPFLGVRFISVNDHYDSKSYMGTTGGIDVAFRNLIYQRYSQDLSEKVKSAMHLKMSRGQYVTHCPYGYKKKQGVKHEMIPDPVTAPIVREIFEATIGGMKSTEIAAMLNAKQVPTPMEYKKVNRKMHSDAMWSHQAVLRIIKEYKYTGAMVNFKCENETIRASVQRKCKPEEWVVVENRHEAIVTHEEYEAANAKLRKVNYKGAKRGDLSDRVYYCAYCGRRLRKTFGNDEYYSCSTKLYRTDSPCCQVRWSRTEIEEIVLAAYKAQLMLMNERYKKLKSQPQSNPLEDCRNAGQSIQKNLDGFTSKNLTLYEQYRDGKFDKEVFLKKKNQLLQQKEELQAQLAKLQEQEEEIIRQQKGEEQKNQALKASEDMLAKEEGEMRIQMYDAIEKVIVYVGKEIDIHWKFDLSFENIP